MAAAKRTLDDPSTSHKSKKSKFSGVSKPTEQSESTKSNITTEEVDFPRGGGTTFTPLELKTIRAEAVKEADEELFEEDENKSWTKKRKRKPDAAKPTKAITGKADRTRIEHLNYKRINVGMKLFGQIVAVLPLILVVSLPNQLYGHVPVTHISTQYTHELERMDENEEDHQSLNGSVEETNSESEVPGLSKLFQVGQYVRAIVTAIHAPGVSDTFGVEKLRDELARASRRVELSLVPEQVNQGVLKADLKQKFTLTSAIKSIEDHGYILDLGLRDVSGFLSFKDAEKAYPNETQKLDIGRLLDVTITSLSKNGRTCNVSAEGAAFTTTSLSEISSVSSILPGVLVQSIITAIHSDGLGVQLLGFFEGTIEQLYMPRDTTGKILKLGSKVQARILYQHSTSPPKFALALTEHLLKLQVPCAAGCSPNSIQETYPIGTILDSLKVSRVESERGLFMEVESGLQGFVHISHVSDDHISSLASGAWKLGTMHRGRVTGYFGFDGLLQLSLRPSILEQKFLRVDEVHVGEVMKGTIKKLTDTGLFVTLSSAVDGVVWPNHYADIALKHPAKRFKTGDSLRIRVLAVDTDRKRISLTAKKTLIDSKLPVISKLEDIVIGIVTHAVVFKVHERYLMVEFFNNLKAIIPLKETSELPVANLLESFPVGRVVQVRIISVDHQEGRVIASMRAAKAIISDVSGVEIGNTVKGSVSEIHKENLLLVLEPSRIQALLSLKNLANHRGITLGQLHVALKVGETLDELVVVTRNPEKGFVIVANKPRAKSVLPSKGAALNLESILVGQIVYGRVTRHTHHGTLVKITSRIGGILHPTDAADNYDMEMAFPVVDSIIKAAVISIDQNKRQLTLSTRHSRMLPETISEIIDPEINDVSDLQVGATVRGYIKSVTEHGLFVTLGRAVDARVQIRELFDEYIKDWKARFEANQLVKGRILGVDNENKKVEMTFTSGTLASRTTSALTLNDLCDGQKVNGIVTKVEDYGLFVQIEGSKLKGLCHKSQLSDNKDADVIVALRGFREGDRVKAAIIGIDKKRISLSLKPSNFNESDFSSEEDQSDGDEIDNETFGIVDDVVHSGDNEENVDEDNEDQYGLDDDGDGYTMRIDPAEASQIFVPSEKSLKVGHENDAQLGRPSLTLAAGFQWHQREPDGDVESDPFSEDSDVDQPAKKKKKRKQIEQDLTADMHTKQPDSNADFERLLLGSPNSSYIWIQYMSFQLQLSEMEKARDIARRALKTINFREEQEKLNVWIALLNLENIYGTDESLEETFKEAARANDSKTVHLRLTAIFDQSEKLEKAEEQFKRTCKKFGKSSKVWTLFGEHYLKRGNIEEARKLLTRCLQSLEKRKHLKTISRFAQLEYKFGDPERGKTLYEGIIDSHPKRFDLWSIYMDMEAGQKNIQSLRNLFDRVLMLKMTSHKAKSFFKKWLELERKIGDEEGASNVKQKAVEWAQKASSA